jgi:hypothetical protein
LSTLIQREHCLPSSSSITVWTKLDANTICYHVR